MVIVRFVPLDRQLGLSAIVPVKQPIATVFDLYGLATGYDFDDAFTPPVTLVILKYTDPVGGVAAAQLLPIAYVHTRLPVWPAFKTTLGFDTVVIVVAPKVHAMVAVGG